MDSLPQYLDELRDSNKKKRCDAYRKVHDMVLSHKGELLKADAFSIIKACLRGFEDPSERAREEAIKITTELIADQDASILDWVLPSIVTRIGIVPVVEESEEIRLLLLKLGTTCMTYFPHDIGPRNYIDFFQVLLENCLCDPFPDLKKEACNAIGVLCTIEPKQVRSISVHVAQVLRESCLLHKHAAVRAVATRTLAILFRCGASEVLKDGKEEAENVTTASQCFVLCNDHSEAVRLGVLDILSCALLDVNERQELHRKYLPHLLLLATDSFDNVHTQACEVLEKVGYLYLMDNEDNRIDLSNRRITMKDIEWYDDDAYPSMSFVSPLASQYKVFENRPSLGVRYAVADAVRGFLDSILRDITSVDWVIPFSTNNRKAVALRVLWMAIYHSEKSCVQFTERVLSALYKVFPDESEEVVKQATLCVEVLGKFLTPDQYLPFLISKTASNTATTTDDPIIQKSRNKTVVLTACDDTKATAPTLFSTAAVTVKCSILKTLKYLILGSKDRLTATHSTKIVQTLTSNDLVDSENESLLLTLLDTLSSIAAILSERKFIASPQHPLPEEVVSDPKQRTLDSILLYSLLRLRSTDLPFVQAKAASAIESLSYLVTGTASGIYSVHIERLLLRYGATLPVNAFGTLVLNSTNVSSLGSTISDIFISRLSEINFSTRVTEELQYFTILERLLWNHTVQFNEQQLSELLRIIILPLAAFQPSNAAHLFRKVAVNCLCVIIERHYRDTLENALQENGFSLSTKVVNLWCSASDSEDSEVRLICVTALPEICTLPMPKGSVSEVVQSILLRLDDSNDIIRLRTISGLLSVLNSNEVSPSIVEEITSQMVPMTRKMLIYLDDTEETIGIRPSITETLKKLGDLSPNIVVDLVRSSRVKHQDAEYCNAVLKYLEEKY